MQASEGVDIELMIVKYTMENIIFKEEKVSITKIKESYFSKEMQAIKLLEALNGLRRKSSLPDMIEGKVGQNLKFRRKCIHRDSDTSSDTISSMES